MKKNTTTTKNTRTPAEIFAFLHSVKSKETICSERLVNSDVQIAVKYGIVIAEVWPVAFGFEVWYSMKPNCNIFNPYFAKHKRFDTQSEVDEFLTELL